MISIANLVETTCMSRHPRPIEITYDQGSEFIYHEFRKALIEIKYGITAKPSTLVNPISNAVMEQIHQILGNLGSNFNITQSYADEDDPWSGILAVAAFSIRSARHKIKFYSPGQLIFVCDIILPIKHTVYW